MNSTAVPIIDPVINQPKYQQLIDAILSGIERGELTLGQQLPSITEWANGQNLAKVTVAKAYEELRQRGVVRSQHGKGFYVASTNIRTPLNVLMIFDTLNAYKETLYESLLASLPPDTSVSMFFHHYNRNLFASLVRTHLGRYNAYAIIPHFEEDVSDILSRIPAENLLLLDHDVGGLSGSYAAVYQNFEADVRSALEQGQDRLRRYRQLTLVLARNHFQYVPEGILKGFRLFCREHELPGQVVDNYHDDLVQPGMALLLFSDRDLVAALKRMEETGLVPGRAVGLISYDDTPMKELLCGGITVISTDFAEMGRTAGRLLTSRHRQKIANPGGLILRQSL